MSAKDFKRHANNSAIMFRYKRKGIKFVLVIPQKYSCCITVSGSNGRPGYTVMPWRSFFYGATYINTSFHYRGLNAEVTLDSTASDKICKWVKNVPLCSICGTTITLHNELNCHEVFINIQKP
jgi:hypothetical protein